MGADPWLLLLTGIMLAFGLVMVYSASWDVSWRLTLDPSALFRRQLTNMLIALIACAIAYRFPLRWLKGLALPMIVVAMLTLLSVLLINAGGGPRRSFLEGSVQPSEMAKLIVIIYLAVWMESKGERISEWGYGFLPLMVIIGIVGGLILLQPDLSAVLTVGVVALVMFYLAGARASQSFVVTLGSGLVGFLLVRVTTTGRERRCGWLDLVALRFAVRLNGMTSLALTKLDVLSEFEEIPVCVRYRLRDGAETSDFPAHQSDFHSASPVYETLPGWREPLDAVEDIEGLPAPARRYVEFVEREAEVEVNLIGTGAERERVLMPRGLEALALRA